MIAVPRALVVFKNCKMYIWSDHYVETVFPDGLKAPAYFLLNTETLLRAKEQGYAWNVRAMHLDHELLHTFLAEILGWPHSSVLRAVAECQHAEGNPIQHPRCPEESVVQAFQLYLRTGQITPFLEQIPDFPARAREYSSRFEKILDGVRHN